MAMVHARGTQADVYDVAHGNAPQFVSGNAYNFHEVKREKRTRPPRAKITVTRLSKTARFNQWLEVHPDDEQVRAALAILDDERAKRQAARRATREAARQARARDTQLFMAEVRPQPEPAPQPLPVPLPAMEAWQLIRSYDKVTTA